MMAQWAITKAQLTKLTPEQQAELKKLGSERIRAKLVKAGYDEDAVFSFDRQMLLDTLAEYTLRPAEAKVSEVKLRGRELEMRTNPLLIGLLLHRVDVDTNGIHHSGATLSQIQPRQERIHSRLISAHGKLNSI